MLNGIIKDLEEGYKYIGIKQSNINQKVELRHKAITEYKKRLRQVLQSQLNARNQVMAIDTFALPVIKYPVGIIKRTEEAIKGTYIAPRKLLTMHGELHPESYITRWYLNRKDGGRELKSVQHPVKEEEQSIKAYIASMATSDKLLAEFQSAALTMELFPDDEEIDGHMKPLHSAYHRQISNDSDLYQTFMWLNKGNLMTNTETLLMAAQKRVFLTKQVQTKIYHTRDDRRCRLCKDAPKTLQHIVNGCKQLAGSTYTKWHIHVAGVVYRSLCDAYGLNKPQHWWEAPGKVNENDCAKILSNLYIRTNKHVLADLPDIVVVDNENKRDTIIYIYPYPMTTI
ncbi:uncharacterized protein [Watersipora subatra]|uniref:uncharacterized protein n=1 Tax=Watersipora subatra TaxID=2589382 RepID=UPI00355C62DF